MRRTCYRLTVMAVTTGLKATLGAFFMAQHSWSPRVNTVRQTESRQHLPPNLEETARHVCGI